MQIFWWHFDFRFAFSRNQNFFRIYSSSSSASAFSTAKGSSTGNEPESAILTSCFGLSRPSTLRASILRTTSIPLMILPNTTWRPSSQVVCFVVMKNWDPFVSFPDGTNEKRELKRRWRKENGKKIYLRWPSTTIRFRNASAWSFRLRNVHRRSIGRQFHLREWNLRLECKLTQLAPTEWTQTKRSLTLNHEVFDDPVEFRAFVSFSLWLLGEFLEIAGSLRDGSSEETDFDATSWLTTDFNIKENLERKK